MKLLKRINRGVLLLCVVLIAVIIYVVQLEVSHSAARPEIEKICKNYVATAVNAQLLPSQYRKDDPKMSTSALDSYLDEQKTKLKAFYPSDEKTYKYALAQYEASMKNQAKGNGVLFDYTKNIVKFSSFSFDGSTVVVSILVDTSINSSQTPGALRTSLTQQTTDTITLQKIGGSWKVVYADLQQPTNVAKPDSFKG